MSDPAAPGPDAPPPMPRWVKGAIIVAVLFVFVFGAVHLAGGGFRGHMHGMHGGDGAAGVDAGAAPTSRASP